MNIPWPQIDSVSALFFGVISAVLTWLAYRAGVRSHDSQLRVEAMTLVDTTKRTLDEVGKERGDLFKWYQSLYAAQGLFYSGAMEVKRREFESFATTIDGLIAERAAAGKGIDRLRGHKLERRLVEVRSIHGRASDIKDKFAQYQRELHEAAAEHRSQALQAAATKRPV